MKESDNAAGTHALIADMVICGVWIPQAEAFFDVHVIDTDAQSYCNRMPREVLKTAEKKKKAKYVTACEQRRVPFTPIYCTVDSVFGNEADVFLRLIVESLAAK